MERHQIAGFLRTLRTSKITVCDEKRDERVVHSHMTSSCIRFLRLKNAAHRCAKRPFVRLAMTSTRH